MPLYPAMNRALDETRDGEGDTTTVLGLEFRASWATAEMGRIQTFLRDEEWQRPAYDVKMPVEVLQEPYNVKNGTVIRWEKTGWEGVVRRLDWIGDNDINARLLALVIIKES